MNAAEKILPVSAFFSEKMKLFTEGRKHVFEQLREHVGPGDQTIWFHAASLGEYEQAVPIIKQVKHSFPKHRIIVSFFSPSGYEIKKNSALADVTTYLPLDTRKNVREFLDLVHPEWALLIKYEFWPNLLSELRQRKIRTLLVSGVFRREQAFFKPYGRWMRKYLQAFDHFFVQNQDSEKLLQALGFNNVSVSGDTRFDRVSSQLEQDNRLSFVEDFRKNKICLVAGSTWPEDEDLLVGYINKSEGDFKYIIAPHTLKPSRIQALKKKIEKTSLLFSELEEKKPENFQVFIIDTIGLLTRIYSYADVAYVGGAAGETGLHNILEPAAFGIPVIIGKNHKKFPEAEQLRRAGGLFSVADEIEAGKILDQLLKDQKSREQHGRASAQFVESKRGATNLVMKYLLKNSLP